MSDRRLFSEEHPAGVVTAGFPGTPDPRPEPAQVQPTVVRGAPS